MWYLQQQGIIRCRVLPPSSEVTKSNGITCIVLGLSGASMINPGGITGLRFSLNNLWLLGAALSTLAGYLYSNSLYILPACKRISIKFLHASLAFVNPSLPHFPCPSTQTIPPPTILLYFHVFCVPESLPHLRPISFPPLTGPPTFRPPWTLQLKHVNLS